jgi:diguanylate cyclase (GGDEF)-like protein
MPTFNKGWFDRLQFRHQLGVIFVVGIIVLTLITSFVVSKVSTVIITKQQIQQGLQVTESLASQSELALLYQSAESARDIAESAINFPEVKGIRIETEKREELYQLGDNYPDTVFISAGIEAPTLIAENNSYWLFSAPVRSTQDYDNQLNILPDDMESFLLGHITVLVGKDTQLLMQRGILRSNLAISIGLAGILLVLILMIARRVTKPIEHLSQTMKRAQTGDSLIRAEIEGPSDITDMQESFNNMMEVLERRQHELHDAMQSALASAKAKGEFAANVTHELRTPMNAVLGMLDLLLTMGLTVKQQEYVETAKSSGHALLSLIDEVLNFSEADAGKINIINHDCSIHETLDDVVGLLANQALKKQIDIGYAVAPEVPKTFSADSGRLRQVLINLAGNAIKFTDSGEVSIYVSAVPSGNSKRPISQLHFRVVDTGIGIDKDDQKRIFEAFTQVDASTTKQYPGTGLGLAISRQLVELMGGHISVSSKLSKGSEFSFTLPIVAIAEPAVEPVYSELKGLTALFVSKAKVLRLCAESRLKSLGLRAVTARSGLEAFKIIRDPDNNICVDLLFVDEDMVDIKLNDFIRIMSEEPSFNNRLTVILSNPWAPDAQVGQLSLPRLNKPLKTDSFLQVLHGTLITEEIDQPKAAPIVDIQPNRPCKVLVVDDNKANQKVAVAMLDKLGCLSRLAENGRQAVECILRERFDLVLMDCNMPVMSGYDATRQVRTYEADNAGTLPIIAMTANNSDAEADKCREAGMNDFLPKPLSLAGLREQLEKWAHISVDEIQRVAEPEGEYGDSGATDAEAGRAADGAAENSATDGSAAGHAGQGTVDVKGQATGASAVHSHERSPLSYDIKVMDALKDAVGDAVGSLIEAFQEDMLIYLQKLDTAIHSDDVAQIRQIAHTIKGSASNFGAYDLVKHSKELEDRATANNIEQAADYARRIGQAFDAVSIDLQQEMSLIDHMDKVSVKPQKQSYRILVVDDDRSIRLLLVNAFRREEYELEEAANGAQAIEVCQRRMPDLILMDAVMPEMDGFDACKAIRETPHGADIPVLMITGLEDESSIVRAFSSGATDYISKPINFSVMKQRVARLIKANKAEKHVKQLAYHDPLTSLPNRANLMQHLRLVVEQAAAEGSKFAILFLDLDRFKMINDTMGHDVGDLLLKAVADRIRNCVRDQDFIARLGGDEFTLVVENIANAQTAAKVAEKICHSLNQPFVFMRKKMFVTTSIGISIFPDNGGDVTDLIKHADSAMFKAKERRNDYCFYESGMEAEIAERLEMERELRQAIERDELVLFYQPKIDFKTGALTGAEALVRWEHPEEGVIAPSVFIPLAEESGLINKLSDWVLEEGARQLKRWIDKGHKLTLALNLSVKDLMAEDLHSQLEGLMQRNQLPRDVLEIEITESTLMSHPELMSTELVKIKDLGISVAIDDFGSGYSSLNYLKRLPVDVLKIDRAFIQEIETDPSDSAIVAGIIALAETLNMETVAEGVENQGQRNILKNLGCNSFQGYLVAKPQPAEQFEQEFLINSETTVKDSH